MINCTNANLLELNYEVLTTGDSEVKGNLIRKVTSLGLRHSHIFINDT